MKKYIAEFIGTLVLVLFGTGIAVVSGGDLVATSLAFGLAIIAEAYVIGGISGCHVNPAVSFAMFLQKKLTKKDFAYYVVAQVLGAITGTAILYAILVGTTMGTASLGANGYESLSATNISLIGALCTEIVLTFVFIYTILGVTSDKKYESVSGIVIGLTLTFVHLLGIKLTGTSVNPARSLAPALFLCGDALKQVWVFIVAPLIGAELATYVYRLLNEAKPSKKK
ncbi:MAG: MIP family channel protein [Bacilli bacterium]|nr:MIP family channel protein [Bacilli bacterium]